jgi:hypothetical protein
MPSFYFLGIIMAEFPFEPYAVGNAFCSACCHDCITITGDNEARCCQTTVSKKECVSPKDCEECKGSGPLKEKINKCTDPDQRYVHEGKTSCCYGECYDNICQTCDSDLKKAVSIDNDEIICCNKTKKKKTKCNECKREKSNSRSGTSFTQEIYKENQCEGSADGKTSCCYDGKCYDPNDKCGECDENDKIYKLKSPPASKPDLKECCGGDFWAGPEKDPCYECNNNKLSKKTNCECCSKTNGEEKTCCPPVDDPGKTACCSTSGECYNPTCDRCE